MTIDRLDTNIERQPMLLGDQHYGAIVDLLGEKQAANLFQLCWVENHGVRPRGQNDTYYFRGLRGPAGALRAVSLVITDRLALIYAPRAADAAALGRWYRRRGIRFEHIVSPAACVTPFWEAYRSAPAGPEASPVEARLIRDQTMYVLERSEWQEHRERAQHRRPEPTGLRVARIEELEPVFLASAKMHHEETLEDPLEVKPGEFRRHVRHRVESDRCFVWFDDHRRLCFKADVSARGRCGAQISGVYTPPPLRGQGLATRGMYDLCARLFDQGVPRVVLYFNRENEPARRVYEKVGFAYYTDYQTVFVAPDGGAGTSDQSDDP